MMTLRPKILTVALALTAAAVTLRAQDMSQAEAQVQLDRAVHDFSDAQYEDAYKQYNKVFTGSRGTWPAAR